MPCKPLWVCSLWVYGNTLQDEVPGQLLIRTSVWRFVPSSERGGEGVPVTRSCSSCRQHPHATSFSTFHSSRALSVWECERVECALIHTTYGSTEKLYGFACECRLQNICVWKVHTWIKGAGGMCAMCALTCLCLHLHLLTHKSCLWWESETHWCTNTHSSHFFSPYGHVWGFTHAHTQTWESNVVEMSSDMAAQRVASLRCEITCTVCKVNERVTLRWSHTHTGTMRKWSSIHFFFLLWEHLSYCGLRYRVF